MDDLKLLAELRRDIPPISPAAARSARAQLLAAARHQRPAVRRVGPRGGLFRVGWRVAVAAALGVALTAGVTVTHDLGVDPEHPQRGGSPAVLPIGVANAAELGERAASAAAARPAVNPRPNQWIYLEQIFAEAKPGAMPYSPVGARRRTSRFWHRIDGKKFAYEYRGRLHQERNYQLSSVFPLRTFAYVRRLPTDPQALLARLYATFSAGGERPYGRVRLSREEQHRRVFDLIEGLLRQNLVPPGVQAAIYRALPRIPGVQLQRDAVDAAGRHGVAFARVHDGHVRAEIILDPRTYQYLGWRQIVVKDFVPNVTVNGKRVTLHVAPGTVFDWQARTAAAIVDRPGQRP